jgi:hypothetical protein
MKIGSETSLRDDDANGIQLRLKMTDTTWYGVRCMTVENVSSGLKVRLMRGGKIQTIFYPTTSFTEAEWANV